MEHKDVLNLLAQNAGQGAYWERSGKDYYKQQGEITDAMLDAHLDSSQPLGVNIVSSKRKARMLVFDVDDHGGHEGWPIMVSRAGAIAGALHQHNVQFFTVRSGGGAGVHFWVVFEEEYSSDHIVKSARSVLETATKILQGIWPEEHFEVGVGGLFSDPERTTHKIEVFPKGEGAHYCIALPFSRESVALDASEIDEHGFGLLREVDQVEVTLMKKQKSGRKSHATRVEAIDYDAAFDGFILDYDVDDRDKWGAAALCLHATFGQYDGPRSEWARDRWLTWSMTSAAFKEGDGDEWDTKTVARYSAITFWLTAQRNGYKGPIPFSKPERRKLTAISFIDDVRLLRDRTGEAIAQIGEHEFVPVASSEFRHYVMLGLMREKGELADDGLLKQVSMYAAACAREVDEEDVWLRFGKNGNARYLYLADKENTIIEVDAAGWRVADNTDIVFRRGDCLPMPMPQSSKVDEFSKFLNVEKDDMPFVLAWMVTGLFNPSGACPIMLLDGPAGSGKSSALKTIIDTLDPKVGSMAGLPEKESDLIAAAHSAGTMSFDNLSTIAKVSDPLCRLATGGGLRKRKLYTDNESVAYDAKRPILLAGIDPTFYKQDLSERLVRVTLTRPTDYVDDASFAALLEANRARFMGGILDLLVLCLRDADQIAEKKSRFATFVRVGEVIARSLGYSDGWFSQAVRDKQEAEIADVALSDYVLMYIVWTIASAGDGENQQSSTSKQWLDRMNEDVRHQLFQAPLRDVPDNAKQMGNRINAAIPHLEKQGIKVTRGRRREFEFSWGIDQKAAEQRFMDEIDQTLPF